LRVLYFVTLGRVVIGLYFLLGGLAKILGPLPGEQIALMAAQGIPAAEQMFALAGACETIGGVCLIIGLHTRLVALLLALFCILVSATMHAFWQIPDAEAQRKLIQTVLFLKNMTTMAGLFAFVGFGPGPLAVDRIYGRGMIV
jgi:putative oxidoreductase